MIGVKVRGLGLALAAVHDLREFRGPVSAEELEQFETDVLAGFVLARASAGLADGTIRGTEPEIKTLFTGWGGELATCRKFAPTARNYTASKLMRRSDSG
ncbi:hypothetical protein OG562_39510 [Streptomyces sp. NBC_01275]|uniref:hypothetical protein n=1 Tax=Streptomyces sp. NBC_01275 TaxID=2903807 RepID=UPI002258FABA|nr:hypothetical protein [Streptomyces sp. NBC_01275]MCX4766953.1 hypothetical protein [Streptomyces sp. NBC_01275]